MCAFKKATLLKECEPANNSCNERLGRRKIELGAKPALTAAVTYDNTEISIIAMCDKATSLCVSEKQALKALCLRYSSIINTEDKLLALTNLTAFHI